MSSKREATLPVFDSELPRLSRRPSALLNTQQRLLSDRARVYADASTRSATSLAAALAEPTHCSHGS
ncbi:MAG: hypothetical protein KC636_00490, partial [Myxococcales bacterium]|nr:hypothetical protein [Myxococcales bacterium]